MARSFKPISRAIQDLIQHSLETERRKDLFVQRGLSDAGVLRRAFSLPGVQQPPGQETANYPTIRTKDYIISGLGVEAASPPSINIIVKSGSASIGGSTVEIREDITVPPPALLIHGTNNDQLFLGMYYIVLSGEGLSATPIPQSLKSSIVLAKIVIPSDNTRAISNTPPVDPMDLDGYIVLPTNPDFYSNIASTGSSSTGRNQLAEIPAEYIAGTLKASDALIIGNTSETVELNAQGLQFKNADGVVLSKFTRDEARIGDILISPTTLESGGFTNANTGFRISSNGNLHVKGPVLSTAGNFDINDVSTFTGVTLIPGDSTPILGSDVGRHNHDGVVGWSSGTKTFQLDLDGQLSATRGGFGGTFNTVTKVWDNEKVTIATQETVSSGIHRGLIVNSSDTDKELFGIWSGTVGGKSMSIEGMGVIYNAGDVFIVGRYNNTTDAVDVTGMALFDQAAARLRYQITQAGVEFFNNSGTRTFFLDSADGSIVAGDTANNYVQWAASTGVLTVNVESSTGGLAVGSTPATTGFLMNTAGLFGAYGGNQRFAFNLATGDADIGNYAGNQGVRWDESESALLVAGSLWLSDGAGIGGTPTIPAISIVDDQPTFVGLHMEAGGLANRAVMEMGARTFTFAGNKLTTSGFSFQNVVTGEGVFLGRAKYPATGFDETGLIGIGVTGSTPYIASHIVTSGIAYFDTGGVSIFDFNKPTGNVKIGKGKNYMKWYQANAPAPASGSAMVINVTGTQNNEGLLVGAGASGDGFVMNAGGFTGYKGGAQRFKVDLSTGNVVIGNASGNNVTWTESSSTLQINVPTGTGGLQVGSAPTTDGVVIHSNGIFGYSSGVKRFEFNLTTGDAAFGSIANNTTGGTFPNGTGVAWDSSADTLLIRGTIDLAEAVVIANGASQKLNAGGDLILVESNTNPSEIQFQRVTAGSSNYWTIYKKVTNDNLQIEPIGIAGSAAFSVGNVTTANYPLNIFLRAGTSGTSGSIALTVYDTSGGTARGCLVTHGSQATLEPNLNNTVDLGNTSVRWKDLYLSGNAYVTGTVQATGNVSVATGANLILNGAGGNTYSVYDVANTRIKWYVNNNFSAYLNASGNFAIGAHMIINTNAGYYLDGDEATVNSYILYNATNIITVKNGVTVETL